MEFAKLFTAKTGQQVVVMLVDMNPGDDPPVFIQWATWLEGYGQATFMVEFDNLAQAQADFETIGQEDADTFITDAYALNREVEAEMEGSSATLN